MTDALHLGRATRRVDLLPHMPLARLLLGYAPAAERARHARSWVLDERLAAILQGGREPALMAIRLAWWRDALAQDDRAKGKGEPLIEAFRAAGLTEFDRIMIGRCIEGWSRIAGVDDVSVDDLHDYALNRGGGLFALLAGKDTTDVTAAGAVWALWDLAAHVSDPHLAQACLAAGSKFLGDMDRTVTLTSKPIRLALMAAALDVRAGRVPKKGFALRHYSRVLLRGVLP